MKRMKRNQTIKTPQALRDVFISQAHMLPYAKLDKNKKKYMGWVSDFGINFKNKRKTILKLQHENDRFLLFVLAVVWSRTGPWENAAYFVSYLKHRGEGRDTVKFWKEKKNRDKEKEEKLHNAIWIKTHGSPTERTISFRKDIFESIGVLAKNWDDIENRLKELRPKKNRNDEWQEFMNYIRQIKGLAVGEKQIFMKIPLILRELRCQGWDGVPGKFCCVVDVRVRKACDAVGIKLIPNRQDMKVLIENSERVYAKFGDLYDIPLFAYKDL